MSIACEQTGQKAFLVELDPLYCDVIVESWEKFAGEQAVRSNDPGNKPIAGDPLELESTRA